jgi:hypothetical protein
VIDRRMVHALEVERMEPSARLLEHEEVPALDDAARTIWVGECPQAVDRGLHDFGPRLGIDVPDEGEDALLQDVGELSRGRLVGLVELASSNAAQSRSHRPL